MRRHLVEKHDGSQAGGGGDEPSLREHESDKKGFLLSCRAKRRLLALRTVTDGKIGGAQTGGRSFCGCIAGANSRQKCAN